MSAPASPAPDSPPVPRSALRLAALALLGLTVFATLLALGTWQIQRRAWNLDLIARVNQRVHAVPAKAPGPAQWTEVNAQRDGYLHVIVQGRFIAGKQTLVHTATELGRGYWVMMPLVTKRGFIVLINRGFVPENLRGEPQDPSATPAGTVTESGLLRMSEPHGGFLRPNVPARDRWYSRDVAAIATAEGLPAGSVAPYFIDADAVTGAARWPRGGMTRIHFYNEHLAYAITWYVLAAMTLVGAGIVIRHERLMRHSAGSRSIIRHPRT